ICRKSFPDCYAPRVQFHAWFDEQLRALGLTTRAFATYAGVSPSGARAWRLGTARPSWANCAAIARVLKVDAGFVRRLAGYEEEVNDGVGGDLLADEQQLLYYYRQTDGPGRQWIREAA